MKKIFYRMLLVILGLAPALSEARAGLSVSALCSFAGTNGSSPRALIQRRDGNLYGTTWNGGNDDMGTIFKLSQTGTLTPLVLLGTNDDLGEALVEGSDGNFYGTTFFGGPGGLN